MHSERQFIRSCGGSGSIAGSRALEERTRRLYRLANQRSPFLVQNLSVCTLPPQEETTACLRSKVQGPRSNAPQHGVVLFGSVTSMKRNERRVRQFLPRTSFSTNRGAVYPRIPRKLELGIELYVQRAAKMGTASRAPAKVHTFRSVRMAAW